jgi:hypothetical protein
MAWCSLVLVLGMGSSYAAMSTIPVEDLARQADTIVLGTVTRLESAWDAQYTAIHTDVTLAVELVLIGPQEEVVTFQVPGGSVDGMGMRTSIDAVFRNGERVIVCLNTHTVPHTVVGMQQGKFEVTGNTVTRANEHWDLEAFIEVVRTAAR